MTKVEKNIFTRILASRDKNEEAVSKVPFISITPQSPKGEVLINSELIIPPLWG